MKKFAVASLVPPEPQERTVKLEMDLYTAEVVFDVLFDVLNMTSTTNDDISEALQTVRDAFEAVRYTTKQNVVLDLTATRLRIHPRAEE